MRHLTPRSYAPSGYNEHQGSYRGPAAPSHVAAARVIQTWLRRRRQLQYAHRLLLCLHICDAGLLPQLSDALEGDGGAPMPPSACAAPSAVPTHEARQHAALYEAVLAYEAALQLENYTRLHVTEELNATSEVARAASPAARQLLRQRHPALRHLAISADALRRAAPRPQPSPASSNPPPPSPRPPHAPSSSAFATTQLSRYLSPPLFDWWRTTHAIAAPAQATRHVDATDAAAPGPAPPLPLHRADSSDGDVSADLPEDGEAAADEAAANAAYRSERAAADAAALEAAQAATMAGCPCGLPLNPDGAADAARRTAASLPSAEAVADVRLVVQPVLGSAARWRARDGAASEVNGDVSRAPPSQDADETVLMCIVCELDGVVVPTPRAGAAADDEDALLACRTCGAWVHRCCACPEASDGQTYCCSHCRPPAPLDSG